MIGCNNIDDDDNDDGVDVDKGWAFLGPKITTSSTTTSERKGREDDRTWCVDVVDVWVCGGTDGRGHRLRNNVIIIIIITVFIVIVIIVTICG